ncbi:MAG: hypothetical protein K2R98_08605 [Gemmataceae bacterium]|nr:hypothetical protein [Gemmataceae bacterium]
MMMFMRGGIPDLDALVKCCFCGWTGTLRDAAPHMDEIARCPNRHPVEREDVDEPAVVEARGPDGHAPA